MRRFVITLLCAAVFTGPASAEEPSGTLQKISNTGEIVIGYVDASQPFSFLDENKQPAGYSIDLCLRVVEAVKRKLGRTDLAVKYVALQADERLPRVVDGTVDIECGTTTHTISRQEQVDFSNMTFITGASLLLPAGSTIQAVGDLGGKRVSVIEGTTTERALRERLNEALVEAKVIVVKDGDQGLKMLEKGEVDAYAGDQIVLIGLARGAGNANKFALAPELFTYEPYGLVVRRNDADFRLIVDATLAQLYRTGEIAQVYQKWFGDWGGRPSRLLLAMYALNGLPE